MKKIFLLTILLFQVTLVFSQVKTINKKGNQGIATGGYKPNRQETPPKKAVNYESRKYENDCYRSFAFTVKNYGYNQDGKFYSWGVSVKNNYSKAVQLRYKLIVGNDNTQIGTLTTYIKPGETYSNDFGKVKAIIVNNNSDQFKIEVSEVCFEGQDCRKNGYLDCNGRQRSGNNKTETDNAKKIVNDNSVSEMKQFLHSTVGRYDNSLLSKIKEIFEKSGYKFQEAVKDPDDERFYLYKFDKITVSVFEDGVDRGFYIDFVNNDELLKFSNKNKDKIERASGWPFRLIYSYAK